MAEHDTKELTSVTVSTVSNLKEIIPMSNYRLYSFVANAYLSPLQCGLQTAHVVSEISKRDRIRFDTYTEWAEKGKTIIICGAGNHKGVVDCWNELLRTGIDTHFVTGAIFREDEQSMNGMATACGVIVPEKYWNTVPYKIKEDQDKIEGWKYICPITFEHTLYPLTHPEGQFIDCIKQYRLA